MKSQLIGGLAALSNALIAVGNFVIVLTWLGAEVAADPNRVAALVITHPAPLLWLEGLKILAALANMLVIWEIDQRLGKSSLAIVRLASWIGVFAAGLLLLAGGIGILAILQAQQPMKIDVGQLPITYAGMNHVINRLGLSALLGNGLWLLVIGGLARKSQRLPGRFCWFTLLLGIVNVAAFFLPPAAMLALLFGLIWSLWLARLLLNQPDQPATGNLRA